MIRLHGKHRVFFARLTRIPVRENDGLVGGVSRGDLIGILGKESTHPVNARTDAEVLYEIKARLQQEGWISGRGFLY